MKSPWTRKNPFLSMYLSGANAVAGAARSRATAEVRRQASTMMARSLKQMAGWWSGTLSAPAPKRRKRKSR